MELLLVWGSGGRLSKSWKLKRNLTFGLGMFWRRVDEYATIPSNASLPVTAG